MHIQAICDQCVAESFRTENFEDLVIIHIRYRDDGFYEYRCANGHQSQMVLQQQRFETLFEISAHAINDGYFREAISSFAASLERFYEYTIRVLLIHSTRDDAIFQSCLRQMNSQSERQLGAFVGIWSAVIKSTPLLPSKSLTELRNRVVHKGQIPTRDQAVKFGDEVLQILRGNLKKIDTPYDDARQSVTFLHIQESSKKRNKNISLGTMAMPTIIGLSVGDKDHHEIGLEEHLSRMQKENERTQLQQLIQKHAPDTPLNGPRIVNLG